MPDPNGNILSVERTGDANDMDDFTYHYKKSGGGTYQWSYDATVSHANVLPADATNQLDHVDDDPLLDGNYADDVDDQAAGNYTYDEIGNLIDDNQEQIDNIEWTIYGKIRRITRDAGSTKPDLEFRYDAMGNRICKIVKPKDGSGNLLDQKQWSYSYYNRDASGNVMAVYEQKDSTTGTNTYDRKLKIKERHLYGAKRVGLIEETYQVAKGAFTTCGSYNADGTYQCASSYTVTTTANAGDNQLRTLGRKRYEITNHLGNVLAVITDRRITIDALTDGTVDYYIADYISTTDYYAFGAAMPDRTFNPGAYRYDFNGKETDPETDLQDYGLRIYNPALGKFLSVDPLTRSYPELTPYQFASNTPISCVDLDGGESKWVIMYWNFHPDGTPFVESIKVHFDPTPISGMNGYGYINVDWVINGEVINVQDEFMPLYYNGGLSYDENGEPRISWYNTPIKSHIWYDYTDPASMEQKEKDDQEWEENMGLSYPGDYVIRDRDHHAPDNAISAQDYWETVELMQILPMVLRSNPYSGKPLMCVPFVQYEQRFVKLLASKGVKSTPKEFTASGAFGIQRDGVSITNNGYHTLMEYEYEGQIFVRDNTTGRTAIPKEEYVKNLYIRHNGRVYEREEAYNLFEPKN